MSTKQHFYYSNILKNIRGMKGIQSITAPTYSLMHATRNTIVEITMSFSAENNHYQSTKQLDQAIQIFNNTMNICRIYNKILSLAPSAIFNFSSNLNCRMVSQEICAFTKKQVEKLGSAPKITVILADDSSGRPNPASQIYVSKKLQLMPKIKIDSELIRVTPAITKQEMESLIDRLNKDPKNTSTMVQLPFPPQYSFDVNEVINQINYNKNIDGFSFTDIVQPNLNNPKALKPPTALGILTLLSYYGIKTQGKSIAIIGKGSLVGFPLIKILQGYPYYATVTSCDIFTENISEITRKADIIIAACGEAALITAADIKEDAILIDAGINEVKPEPSKALHVSSLPPSFAEVDSQPQKRRIIGDICRSAYHKSKYYTPVPGGVGLLTVASLAFNVLNSFLLQRNQPTINLEMEFLNKGQLKDFVTRLELRPKKTKVMLLSSAYNGLTQKIDKSLANLGYETYFQVAASEAAMREGVRAFQPDLIICPTLMKAIPEDIYAKTKCLIVHPGIKGDRGPSSIDWAILNGDSEWGVTLLEADKEMDAGDIWATENFPLRQGLSKVEVYNNEVSRIAEKLVLRAVAQFESGNFKPEKLNYADPSFRGRLHRTIRLADAERAVDWETEGTEEILRKAQAADTQPGLKVKLLIGDQTVTRFTYGYVAEREIVPPASVRNGEAFLRKYEAVCVKTKDGAVWIQQMRNAKSSAEPHPFKVPSTLQLGRLASALPEVRVGNYELLNANTFQEVTLEKRGSVGVVGFDFYNGAMSTAQCERMAAAVEEVAAMKDVDVLVFAGSKRNWSNGIHLNVIEHAAAPEEEAWNNIVAINKVVKGILRASDKLTVSAVQANAGAGGVFLALAADYCFAREGVVLNPHYRNMGLYGSELHTASAASKFGNSILAYLKDSAKPLLVSEALSLKLLDPLPPAEGGFLEGVLQFAQGLAADKKKLRVAVAKRNEKRRMLFKFVTLEDYERAELQEMRADIFSNRHGFAQKRRAFVTKQPL